MVGGSSPASRQSIPLGVKERGHVAGHCTAAPVRRPSTILLLLRFAWDGITENPIPLFETR